MRTALNPVVSALPSTSFPQATFERSQSTLRRVLKQSPTWIARGRGAALRELESLRSSRPDPVEDAPTVTKLEWEKPLQIIKYPDPRLRAQNSKIGVFDSSLQQLAAEMLKAMYDGDDGVGLAAPQVGINLRLMVFNPSGKKGKDETEYVLVNPKIVSSNNTQQVFEEGCLSFPKIFGDVERPTTIKVKAQDMKGAKMLVTLKGWNARIFQHEYDHLQKVDPLWEMPCAHATRTNNGPYFQTARVSVHPSNLVQQIEAYPASPQGVLFHDRMKPNVLEKVKPELRKLENEFRAVYPDTLIQTVD